MAKRKRKPTIESVEPLSENDVLDMAPEPTEPVAEGVPSVTEAEVPTVKVAATEMVNVSATVRDYPGMGAKAVEPGGACPIPSDPLHVQYLLNHGFELR